MKTTTEAAPSRSRVRRERQLRTFKRKVRRSIPYYVLIALPLIYLLIFRYEPMYGLQIAFRDFKASKGILGSPWVGMKYFKMFLTANSAWQVISNTFIISLYSLAAGFPFPILLALALNGLRSKAVRKTVQMATYLPYFISTVVLVALVNQFTDMHSGIINVLIQSITGKTINFMGDLKYFRHVYVWSGVWQGAGYSAIIYIAALSSINPELYDAALVDGANKLQRIWHIDLPGILPTVVTLLILNCGQILSVGFEKVYLMQNNINLTQSEVITTYTYKLGLQNGNFSMSAAVGMFNSLVNFAVLLITNSVSKKISGYGVW